MNRNTLRQAVNVVAVIATLIGRSYAVASVSRSLRGA
jgi:hypothetical protein